MTSKILNKEDGVSSTIQAPHVAKGIKEIARAKLDEFIKEETKIVKGIFQCFESPGASLEIYVKKYPGIAPFRKTMTDGLIYEVPLYVARHLNGTDVTAGALGDASTKNSSIGSCSYPIHGFIWKPGEQAPNNLNGDAGIPVPIVGITKRIKRFGFQSLEFASEVA